jgi:hypothetical protein
VTAGGITVLQQASRTFEARNAPDEGVCGMAVRAADGKILLEPISPRIKRTLLSG